MGTITRLENYDNDGYKTPHFLKILVSSSPLSSYSPNGRKSHPVQAISMLSFFNNLALIQDNNLLCTLSNGQTVSNEIKVLSKAMRLSTIRFSVKISKLLVASSKIKTGASVKRARARAIL